MINSFLFYLNLVDKISMFASHIADNFVEYLHVVLTYRLWAVDVMEADQSNS